jgi:poly(3-hydroxybutyrate) depolymerase
MRPSTTGPTERRDRGARWRSTAAFGSLVLVFGIACDGKLLQSGDDGGIGDAAKRKTEGGTFDAPSAGDGSGALKDGPRPPSDGSPPKVDKAHAVDQSTTADTGVAYSGTFPKGTGYLSTQITLAGTTRTVELYVPTSLKSSPALLLTFHGTNDDAKDIISSSYAQDLADTQGLLVVSPWARTMTTGDWDNHSSGDVYWETYPSTTPSTNSDLRLVMALVQEAVKSYGVNRKRVYTLGHSNGGFFSILAATALPNWIAAFAANSSGLVRCPSTASCTFTGSGTTCATLAAQSGWSPRRAGRSRGTSPTATPTRRSRSITPAASRAPCRRPAIHLWSISRLAARTGSPTISPWKPGTFFPLTPCLRLLIDHLSSCSSTSSQSSSSSSSTPPAAKKNRARGRVRSVSGGGIDSGGVRA